MRELYVEDLANHDGPEPCVGVPQGRSEASVGVRAGLAIEPRNHNDRVLTLFRRRKAMFLVALSRVAGGLCAVGEPGMYGISMRENREVPWSTVGWW